MKVTIICREASIHPNKVGLQKLDSNILVVADMSDDQMKHVFYQIWSKAGDDQLQEWIVAEGFKLTKS